MKSPDATILYVTKSRGQGPGIVGIGTMSENAILQPIQSGVPVRRLEGDGRKVRLQGGRKTDTQNSERVLTQGVIWTLFLTATVL